MKYTTALWQETTSLPLPLVYLTMSHRVGKCTGRGDGAGDVPGSLVI